MTQALIDSITPADLADCVLCANATEEVIDGAVAGAVNLFMHITGGIIRGRETVTVRPCAEHVCAGYATCGCGLPGIRLPGVNPVVTEVKIDGNVVPTAHYKMLNGYTLVRVGPGDPPLGWPWRQKLYREPTQPDTFAITYTRGVAADAVTRKAITEIVCSILNNGGGLVGANVTSATLDGLTVDAADGEDLGFTWLQRLLSSADVRSYTIWDPEMDGGWVLHELT